MMMVRVSALLEHGGKKSLAQGAEFCAGRPPPPAMVKVRVRVVEQEIFEG